MGQRCTWVASTCHSLSRRDPERCTSPSPRPLAWLEHFLKSAVRPSPFSHFHSFFPRIATALVLVYDVQGCTTPPLLLRILPNIRGIGAVLHPPLSIEYSVVVEARRSHLHRRFGFVGWNSRRFHTREAHADAPRASKGWRRNRRKRGKKNVQVPARWEACVREKERSEG